MYFILYILIGILWGCTNVFIKIGCKEKKKEKKNEKKKEKNTIEEIITILKNINIILPYLLNQIGSMFYYFLLFKSDISLTVPLSNVSSFVFTYITEIVILKKNVSYKSVLG
ncbi:Drosophila melanogaster CG12929 gene product, partial [Plasmodium yoelii yoelii]